MTSQQVEATAKVLNDVLIERSRQVKKWGVQDHNPTAFIAILTEEVGEAAKEAVQLEFESDKTDWSDHIERLKRLRKELIESAAVAVQFVERLEAGALADHLEVWDHE